MADWNNLPGDLVICIAKRLGCLTNYFRFSIVCKSWHEFVSESSMIGLSLPPSDAPLILLAEKVAPGALYDHCKLDSNYSDTEDEKEEEDSSDDDDDDDDDDDKETYKYFHKEAAKYNYINNSISSSRDLYNLSNGKTYTIDLPEAAGRLILGLNNGWILTLGRDLQINLLYPLLRHQITLAPMLTFKEQYEYDEDNPPEEVSDKFILKAAISTNDLNHLHTRSVPTVMVIYISYFLGYTKLGDKVWTHVNTPSDACSFEDIIYHNGNFYAVDCRGGIFVCSIDDDEERGHRCRKIASFETNDWDQKYLVKSSSGSNLFVVVRYHKSRGFRYKWLKYRTIGFSLWRLDLKHHDSFQDISCTLTKETDLGNQAIFIGRNTSVSMPSSKNIKPNSIYFTDAHWEYYYRRAGGHDMGIFNVEHHTIEPHFQGTSIHPISPPIWYF